MSDSAIVTVDTTVAAAYASAAATSPRQSPRTTAADADATVPTPTREALLAINKEEPSSSSPPSPPLFNAINAICFGANTGAEAVNAADLSESTARTPLSSAALILPTKGGKKRSGTCFYKTFSPCHISDVFLSCIEVHALRTLYKRFPFLFDIYIYIYFGGRRISDVDVGRGNYKK